MCTYQLWKIPLKLTFLLPKCILPSVYLNHKLVQSILDSESFLANPKRNQAYALISETTTEDNHWSLLFTYEWDYKHQMQDIQLFLLHSSLTDSKRHTCQLIQISQKAKIPHPKTTLSLSTIHKLCLTTYAN